MDDQVNTRYIFHLLNGRIPVAIWDSANQAMLDSSSVKIIYFTPPKSLQYYTIKPLILDLKSARRGRASAGKTRMGMLSPNLASSSTTSTTITSKRSAVSSTDAELHRKLETHANDLISQPSECIDVDACLQIINSQTGCTSRSSRRGSRVKDTSRSSRRIIPKFISAPFLFLCSLIAVIFKAIIVLLNTRLPFIGTSLCRLSSTAQQLNLRSEQVCFWPAQYAEWYSQSQDDKKSPYAQAQYIGFFNTFWLIANDVIIGGFQVIFLYFDSYRFL